LILLAAVGWNWPMERITAVQVTPANIDGILITLEETPRRLTLLTDGRKSGPFDQVKRVLNAIQDS
jgi:hypothetical protein